MCSVCSQDSTARPKAPPGTTAASSWGATASFLRSSISAKLQEWHSEVRAVPAVHFLSYSVVCTGQGSRHCTHCQGEDLAGVAGQREHHGRRVSGTYPSGPRRVLLYAVVLVAVLRRAVMSCDGDCLCRVCLWGEECQVELCLSVC